MARILAIDDDPSVLGLIPRLLAVDGHEVRTADGGDAGVQLAREWRPDLILCDIVMPDPNGFEVLAALRRDPATNAIPLIFLTGVADPTQLRAGRALGADDYLLKPFTRDELSQAVEARLTRAAFVRREASRRLQELEASLAGSLPQGFLDPLSALVALSGFLREQGAAAPPELVCEIANGIFEGSRRLHERIEKLLLYADLERLAQANRTSTALEERRTDQAAALVTRVAEEVASRHDRRTDLALDVEEAMAAIDAGHLETLTRELTDNALRYSPAGTPVAVSCRGDGDGWVRLSVTDRGPGLAIAPEAEDSGPVRMAPGFGLPIARRICSLYGAELGVESRPGAGATVSVTLRRVPTV